jgi:hypothetical protein
LHLITSQHSHEKEWLENTNFNTLRPSAPSATPIYMVALELRDDQGVPITIFTMDEAVCDCRFSCPAVVWG